jgi:hypothetical protein
MKQLSRLSDIWLCLGGRMKVHGVYTIQRNSEYAQVGAVVANICSDANTILFEGDVTEV